jgi:ribosomal protein S18 acetylase RimI-like enzyme
MNDVIIRGVSLQDLDACFTVESCCFLPSEAASREKIEKRITRFPCGFFVAESNGTVIDHINGASTDKEDISDEEFKEMVGHDDSGKNIVIFAVAVLPPYQGKGIASQLMSRFIEESKKLNKRKIMLICKSDLIAYYEKCGFVYIGKSASTHGGFEWYEMHLHLEEK